MFGSRLSHMTARVERERKICQKMIFKLLSVAQISLYINHFNIKL